MKFLFKKGTFATLSKAYDLFNEERISKIQVRGKRGIPSVSFNILFDGSSSDKKFQKLTLTAETASALNENVKFDLNDNYHHFLNMLVNSDKNGIEIEFDTNDSGNCLVVSSEGIKSSFTTTKKDDEQNDVIVAPILSFTKKKFEEHFNSFKGLSDPLKWVDNKIAGINIITTLTNGYLYLGTQAFYSVKNIDSSCFFREASGGFNYNPGVVLVTDEILNFISESLVNDDSTVLFRITQPVSGQTTVSYGIEIGNLSLYVICFAREKAYEIMNTIVSPFIESKNENKVSISLKWLNKFFSVFDRSSVFMTEAVSFNVSNKILSIVPVENSDSAKLFEVSLALNEAKNDTKIELNFYVLSKLLKKLEGEEVEFIEKKDNPNRILLTDGKTNFVVGKLKKQKQ